MKIKLFGLLIIAALSSCAYSFGGASIPAEMKTVTVRIFENNAPLVVPTLSNQFTEAVKTRIRNQTRLSITPNEGQAVFEGRITGYDIKPIALQSNSMPTAAGNRLTITVAVKFTNTLDSKGSFEESFTRYYDFLNGASIQSLLPAAIENINKQLTEDIFNRAFAQW
ncbi:LptE family protein [Pedobacter rhizosphaerae]|uniref:Lipopolysaccharide-assembly n=1 Tax=Pedobacter rhizosphaerae TaxID=390241 RepID=A0A1H9J413_9SPHI|nr:LptE family protein [Pedobacter rhizosphaerae]SEQ81479.1 Lipopolysaccharide-assembly [Pedobacter rhizosphaerae]